MPDLLVPLYKLPMVDPNFPDLRATGVIVRRANPWELTPTRAFIAEKFAQTWADEAACGFANHPVSVYLAIIEGNIVGFAAYEATRRNFFGPTGVEEQFRGRGIGKALLLACLQGLKDIGYAYAIIGGAGPVEFYKNACGAIEIEGSVPGIYTDLLPKNDSRHPEAQRGTS